MFIFHSKSLRTRLMMPIAVLVVLILALISFSVIWSAKGTFDHIAAKVADLTSQIKTRQDETMARIEQRQLNTAEASLQTKAHSMAGLVAGLARIPILTFDFDVLDDYCAALTRDPDIVLAYVVNPKGEFLTSFRNEKNEAIQSLVKNIDKLSLTELADELQANTMIFSTQVDIIQDQKILGHLVLLFSHKSVQEHAAAIHADFKAMTDDIHTVFVSLHEGVQEQVEKATSKNIRQATLAGLAGIIILIMSFAVLINRLIIKPVTRVMGIMGEMAEGHLSGRLRLSRDDEIGQMADSIDTVSDELENNMLVSLNKLAAGDLTFKVTPKSSEDAINNALLKTLQSLTAAMQQIQENASVLTDSSENLSAVSSQLAAGSEESSAQAANVAAATEQINVSSQNIKSTAGQLSENMQELTDVTATISKEVNEIGGKAGEGSKISENALEKAGNANATIQSLQEAADEIGVTTAAIEEITDQTKLLALNATIEAARAGEAGKGFAVVAGEVKELAKQSADAAEVISGHIKGIQNKTGAAAKAINEVSEIIKQLNASSEMITTAVNNHSRETESMLSIVKDSKNGVDTVTEGIVSLARGAHEVASNIQGVSVGMEDSSKGIRQVNGAAGELSKLAVRLQTLVEKFDLKTEQ